MSENSVIYSFPIDKSKSEAYTIIYVRISILHKKVRWDEIKSPRQAIHEVTDR